MGQNIIKRYKYFVLLYYSIIVMDNEEKIKALEEELQSTNSFSR